MLGAVATLNAIGGYYTPLTVKNGVTNKGHLLLLSIEQIDSSRWADLTTKSTIVETITLIETHHWLHYTLQAIFSNGWLQDVGRAFAHAEMAGRTLCV